MPAKTIAIFSTKGGVGRTLVAMNLAVAIGDISGRRTLLVDLDLQAAGDIAKLFNVPARRCMLDLAGQINKNAEGEPLKECLVRIENYLVDLLPAVLSPRQSPHLSAETIKTAFAHLEKNYEYIIVDAGKAFSESLLGVLNNANLILLVVTPDVLSVYQTKWALDILQSLHIPLNMIKLVLNRAESVGSTSWQEVRAAIPCEIISRIPSEGKAVGLSLNRNVPIVVDSPRSKVAQAINKLAQDLLEKKELYLERRDIEMPAGEAGSQVFAKGGEFWQKYQLSLNPQLEGEVREVDEIIELKNRIHQKLIEKLVLKHVEIDMANPQKAQAIRERTEKLVSSALAEESGVFLSSFEIRKKLIKDITDEALGLGPLEDLIDDSDISDIMVNNKDQIYIERHGKIELTAKRFISNDQVRQVIERIISPLGRRIDESTPMVDARLLDGSRVNAIIPPLALTGPSLTIRKFGRERLTVEDLLRFNSMSEQMKEFLRACIELRKNIIVSGGTGSGKTTVLNVLSTFIPPNDRIITIEDAAELKLKQMHWVRLESRPPNIEGRGAVTTRDLFRNSLRMRPDRIIIGECRGAESLDMLQAMNTGHDGSLTTIHANSTQDVLSRLDSMILMSGVELPIRAIREMIASAIDIIVHTARLSDGSRKVIQISELAQMKDELHINMEDIFVFKQSGVDAQGHVLGEFQATGYIPSFLNEIKVKGIALPENTFQAP